MTARLDSLVSEPPEAGTSAAVTKPTADLLEHEYDGIREYDNPLPRWWVWMFAGSFFFSIGYFFHYHVSHNGKSVAAAYDQDVAEARAIEAKRSLAAPVSEASLAALMADPAVTEESKALFGARCAPCHGDQAQGVIGPNLTDNAWLHGDGSLSAIYQLVENGVPEKGMPAWGRQLTPVELRKLVAFVGSQRGKNVPGKAAQGNVVP